MKWQNGKNSDVYSNSNLLYRLHATLLFLGLELVGPKFRSLVGQQYQVIQCIGVLVFVALSYFIRHFRMLMLVYAIPIVLYMLLWL